MNLVICTYLLPLFFYKYHILILFVLMYLWPVSVIGLQVIHLLILGIILNNSPFSFLSFTSLIVVMSSTYLLYVIKTSLSSISISPIRSVEFAKIPLYEEPIDIPVICLQTVSSPFFPIVLQNWCSSKKIISGIVMLHIDVTSSFLLPPSFLWSRPSLYLCYHKR